MDRLARWLQEDVGRMLDGVMKNDWLRIEVAKRNTAAPTLAPTSNLPPG